VALMAAKKDGVIASGTLDKGRMNWDSPHMVRRELEEMGDGRVVVHVDFATERAVASLKAIRYYRHALGLIAKETGNDKDDLHQFYRGMFLTETVMVANKQTGDVAERDYTKSTTEIDPDEMWKFTEKVREHAGGFFGVIVPPPDPEYARYRGQS
jgi:hypothetical protein